MLDLETLKTMTPAALLGTPFQEIFPPTMDELKRRYRILASIWAPDRNPHPEAGSVMAYLNVSRDHAEAALKTGTWPRGNVIDFMEGSKSYDMAYLRTLDLGWAKVYLSKASVLYVQQPGAENLFARALKHMQTFRPPAGHPFESKPPFRIENVGTSGGAPAFRLIPRGPMARGYLGSRTNVLKDAVGDFDPRAVGWILNRAFDWLLAASRGLGGGPLIDLSPELILVDPESHAILPLSGWGCLPALGQPASAIPQSFRAANKGYIKGEPVTEAHLTRLVLRFGRTLLGDPTGVTLHTKGLPESLVKALNSSDVSSILSTWSAWKLALVEAYGPPKFVEWKPTFQLPSN